jgi:hypothetical protein
MAKKIWIALALERDDIRSYESIPPPTPKRIQEMPSGSPGRLSDDRFPSTLDTTSPRPVSTEKTPILPSAGPDEGVSTEEASKGLNTQHSRLLSGMKYSILRPRHFNMVRPSDVSPKLPHFEPADKAFNPEHSGLSDEKPSGGVSCLESPRPLSMGLGGRDFGGGGSRFDSANIGSLMKGRSWSNDIGSKESPQGVPREENIVAPGPSDGFGNVKLYHPPHRRVVKWHWTCCQVCVLVKATGLMVPNLFHQCVSAPNISEPQICLMCAHSICSGCILY